MHQGIALVEDSVAPKCKPSQLGPPRGSLDGGFQSHFSRGLVVKDWLHLLVTPGDSVPYPGAYPVLDLASASPRQFPFSGPAAGP